MSSANADDAGARRFAEPRLHPPDHEVAQLRVREAEFRAVGRALALEEAEPFRVPGEMFLRWHQRVESVDEALVVNPPAAVGCES